MSCARYREALSARLDGEPPGLAPAELEAHLQACAGCREWHQAAAEVSRHTRITDATSVPDLTGPITARITAHPPRTRRVERARAGLAAVAVAQLVIAVPTLIGLTHVSHETAAFEIGLSLGLIIVALRPARATGLIPVVAAALLVLAPVAGRDIALGQADPAREAGHLLLVIALVLLLALRSWTRPDRHGGPVRTVDQDEGAQNRAA